MKRLAIFALLVLTSTGTAAEIAEPALVQFSRARSGEKITVIALLEESRARARSRTAAGIFQANQESLRRLLARLPDAGARSREIQRAFSIVPALALKVDAAGLEAWLKIPGVAKIYPDLPVSQDLPRVIPFRSMGFEALFSDAFRQIGWDRMREANPELDGRGVVIGHLDTGVDASHPLLRESTVLFYDSTWKRRTAPFDIFGHGTHTAGTMVGGLGEDPLGRPVAIGVAPGARLLAATIGNSLQSMLAGMQFFLDPDGDPATADSPRVINNSWNSKFYHDQEVFYRLLDAWADVGILPVFSIGNEGPGPATVVPPHEHPATLSVAATRRDEMVAEFSSRGPGRFRGRLMQKPELAAPGENIWSAAGSFDPPAPGVKYLEMSGTSMAAPHVTAAAALLLQLRDFSAQELKEIIVSTVRTGASGKKEWEPDLGYGILDLPAAVAEGKRRARRESSSRFSSRPSRVLPE